MLLDLRSGEVAANGLPPLRLRAVHVDHQLQPAAADFARACRRQARRWRLPLTVLRVQVDRSRGRSPEDAAREARRQALRAALRPGEWLLQAQHADDQVETSLLQWLRGAGPAGLAGMPPVQDFGRGRLVRPFLDTPGAELRGLLEARGIPWVEDPTNRSSRFDRNYLRLEVLPLLRARWPGLQATAGRSARLAAVAAEAVGRQARRDVAMAADGAGLDLRRLRCLPPARRQEALRAWLKGQDVPLPDERRVLSLLAVVMAGGPVPVERWAGVELRQEGQRLLCRPRGAMEQGVEAWRRAGSLEWHWQRDPRLGLPDGGQLAWRADRWGPVDLARLPPKLSCTAWRGGLALHAGGRRRPVGEVLRSAGLPAWLRGSVPLLWAGRSLVAVADIEVDEACAASPEARWRGRFIWQQH